MNLTRLNVEAIILIQIATCLTISGLGSCSYCYHVGLKVFRKANQLEIFLNYLISKRIYYKIFTMLIIHLYIYLLHTINLFTPVVLEHLFSSTSVFLLSTKPSPFTSPPSHVLRWFSNDPDQTKLGCSPPEAGGLACSPLTPVRVFRDIVCDTDYLNTYKKGISYSESRLWLRRLRLVK